MTRPLRSSLSPAEKEQRDLRGPKHPKARKLRPMGEVQKACLRSLAAHGSYYPGGPWLWDNTSKTIAIMESLVHRGYAVSKAHLGDRIWSITISGRQVAEKLGNPVQAVKLGPKITMEKGKRR